MMRTALIFLLSGAAYAGVGCGDEDRHFVMSEETLVEPTGERDLGGGCMAVTEGTRSGTGGGSADPSQPALKFGVTFEGLDDAVRVVVTGGNNSVERIFDENWLRGETPAETVEVEIDSEHRYRVRLSGGSQCVVPK